MTTEVIPTVIESEAKKKLAIYYTPPKLTEVLCSWAIKNSKDSIFEPSFGGCGFLEASYQRLRVLDNNHPIGQLYGCDIDANAFKFYLLPKYQSEDTSLTQRFVEKDFLKVTPDIFSVRGFNAVVGNPPFIAYNKMSPDQRLSILDDRSHAKFGLDKRASLWAYFVLHGFSFLKTGGRLGFVLPSSFLHSDYALAVRNRISSVFKRSIAIQVGERLFKSEGTDEKVSILLAEGFNESPPGDSPLRIEFAPTLDDVAAHIESWQAGENNAPAYNSKVSYRFLSDRAAKNFKTIKTKVPVVKLGDIADVLIGVVTGANHFFVVDRSTLAKWEIPSEFQMPVFSKFRMAHGISFTARDWEIAAKENFRCTILNTKGKKRIRDKDLKKYLDSFSRAERNKNRTFKKRPLWHFPLYMRVPDAFFPYMHNAGPKIILNDAKVICTNTIHCIYFKKHKNRPLSKNRQQLLAISVLSSFSQLSAELEGRVYGSGALKLEPSEAKSLEIVMPPKVDGKLVSTTFNAINRLLKTSYDGSPDIATEKIIRKLADEFLASQFDDFNCTSILNILSNEIELVRERRR